jgi:hypothetical protein
MRTADNKQISKGEGGERNPWLPLPLSLPVWRMTGKSARKLAQALAC